MGEYVGSADQFTFHTEIIFDHVLRSRQKLQYTAAEDVALRPPGGLVEWSGDLGARQFLSPQVYKVIPPRIGVHGNTLPSGAVVQNVKGTPYFTSEGLIIALLQRQQLNLRGGREADVMWDGCVDASVQNAAQASQGDAKRRKGLAGQ
jgi:hypothetical protein